LHEHPGHDAVGRALHQLHGKASPDAKAHEEELADAEVIHQPQLVVRKRTPGIVDWNWTAGLAAIGVSLVHGDAPKLIAEDVHGVEHGGRPVADPRVQTAAGGHQERKARSGFLVSDPDAPFLIIRHAIPSPAGLRNGEVSCRWLTP
jgi:hypothetical protein